MNTETQIKDYIKTQLEPKRTDMLALHDLIRQILPKGKLWFLDGKDDKGKVVSNPNFGYGNQIMKYADGTSRDFYQIGISPNTTGISIYIMGLPDKKYLANTYGDKLGKAKVTGYCIKFRKLEDIDLGVLEQAIRYGINETR